MTSVDGAFAVRLPTHWPGRIFVKPHDNRQALMTDAGAANDKKLATSDRVAKSAPFYCA
jgi:hypothetical protein